MRTHAQTGLLGVPKHMTGSSYYYYHWDLGPHSHRVPKILWHRPPIIMTPPLSIVAHCKRPVHRASAQYGEKWGFKVERPWALTRDTTVYKHYQYFWYILFLSWYIPISPRLFASISQIKELPQCIVWEISHDSLFWLAQTLSLLTVLVLLRLEASQIRNYHWQGIVCIIAYEHLKGAREVAIVVIHSLFMRAFEIKPAILWV